MKNNPALRNRSLWILGTAEAISSTGNWISMMAIFALLVFRDQGSVTQSSAVYLAGLLPILLCSPLAGWLCDRVDRKWMMIASEALAGLTILGLVFTTRPVWIYALLALQAIFITPMTPARQAALPHLVPPEQLPQANAFLQQLASIIKILAPSLAGLVLAVLPPQQAILLDVLSFALSALILTRLPALPPQKRPLTAAADQTGGPVSGAFRQQPLLALLFGGFFLVITVIIGFDVLSPLFVRDTLFAGEQFFGLIVSMIGLGTLLASLFLLLPGRKATPWSDLIAGLSLAALLPGSLAFAAHLGDPAAARWVTLAGCLIGGVGNGLVVVQSATLLQTLSPSACLGRILGLFQSVVVAGQLAGMLLTPLLVPAVWSMGVFFLSGALAVVLITLALFLGVRRFNPPLRPFPSTLQVK